MQSCQHEECNRVREVASSLFDGKPLKMVDVSEDTPGAEPYGAACRLSPRAYFQAQHEKSGKWFLVTMYEIRDPRTEAGLNEYAARIGAEADSTAKALS